MNQLDKIFRHKLEHHTTDVPAGAWENIVSRLDAEDKKPKRPFLFYGSILFVLLTASFAFFIYEWRNSAVAENKGKVTGHVISNTVATVTIPENQTTAQNGTVDNSVASTPGRINTDISPARGINLSTRRLASADLSPRQNNILTAENADVVPEQNASALTAIASDMAGLSHTRTAIEVAAPLESPVKKVKFFRELKFMTLALKEKAAACPFNAGGSDKSLDVYFSHDYAHSQLAPKDESAQDYAASRNQTESPMYSFSAGVRFGYNVGYRWNLYTGFNYSQANEKFEYIDPESNQIRIITIKDYIYENGKIVDSVLTEEKVVVQGTTKVKVYNKYRTFDLPLLARYTLLANSSMSLSAVGGLYVNLAFSEKGMMLDMDNEKPVKFTSQDTDPQGIFRSQVGITPYASLSMAYHLTGNMDLLIEPNARFQTKSLTSDLYPLSQRFNTFGISTGLRYKF